MTFVVATQKCIQFNMWIVMKKRHNNKREKIYSFWSFWVYCQKVSLPSNGGGSNVFVFFLFRRAGCLRWLDLFNLHSESSTFWLSIFSWHTFVEVTCTQIQLHRVTISVWKTFTWWMPSRSTKYQITVKWKVLIIVKKYNWLLSALWSFKEALCFGFRTFLDYSHHSHSVIILDAAYIR